ncbi:hypothetical protein IG631_13146 [Alternaria alternata]|nr:hypothetical protein IG631_13146 [Alternaria alternata]
MRGPGVLCKGPHSSHHASEGTRPGPCFVLPLPPKSTALSAHLFASTTPTAYNVSSAIQSCRPRSGEPTSTSEENVRRLQITLDWVSRRGR